jgi:hypothetical protein
MFKDDSVWATQAKMAELFQTDRSSITKHIQNIFQDGELIEKSVCAKIAQTANDGKNYNPKHYNLDMIISVGYRVNSKIGTKFRIWATQRLKEFVTNGYSINEKALAERPDKMRELAQRLRKLRTEEKSMYALVREVFKQSAVDYNSNSPTAKSFFAIAQDKFHYAITQKTSAEIVLERADANKFNMGMTSTPRGNPAKASAKIGKSYLDADELFFLENISEQFLLFAESKAFRRQKMTMEELTFKLNTLLTANDYPVLYKYETYLRGEANCHADKEYEKWNQKRLAEKERKRIADSKKPKQRETEPP